MEIKDLEKFFCNNMKVNSLQDVNEWFIRSRNDDFRIDGLDETVELLNSLSKDTPIHIIGDYDVDGIMSTLELVTMAKEAGFTDVSYRIPKRFSEGYGMNNRMIEEINSGVIITCDNGIAAIEQVKRAKEKGLTVIVTDHHLAYVNDGEVQYPEADIIIDPNAIPGSADFNGYCGAGIAYKLCQRMFKNDKKILGKYQVMAAVATICDVMDLVEENYVIVKDGLKKLIYPYYCTTGMYALAEAMGLLENCSADGIGYKLGPALNALSRLHDDGGMLAVKYMSFNGPYPQAMKTASWIEGNNNKRKELSRKGVEDAMKIIADEHLADKYPITIYIPGLLEGIIGIVAGRICEDFNVPVVVFTDMEGGFLKGSGRAPEGYKLKANLDKVSEYIYRYEGHDGEYIYCYGGHDGAAGLTIEADKLDDFREKLIERSDFFDSAKAAESVDFEIEASLVKAYVEEQNKYEPFGKGNPKPVFRIKNVVALPQSDGFIRFMGGKKDIVKIVCKGFEAISFNQADFFKKNKDFNRLEMVGTLGENKFNGKVTPQVDFVSQKVWEEDEIRTSLAEALRAKAKELSA